MKNKPTKISPELKEAFLDLECALSPESLTCDGELTDAQVRSRHSVLVGKWRKLESQLGRRVTDSEVAAWAIEAMYRRVGVKPPKKGK